MTSVTADPMTTSTITMATTAATNTTTMARTGAKRASTEASEEIQMDAKKAKLQVQANWSVLPHNMGVARPGRSDDGTPQVVDARVKNESLSVTEPKSDAQNEKQGKRKNKERRVAYPYGLTPGRTPYPDWPGPSADACEEVHRLLAEAHGRTPKQPDVIPAPSLEITGCGEVESVLDALLRTLLSGATTMNNSNMQFQALVKKFGTKEHVNGQKSLDWDAVRQTPQKDVYETIKSGGLAKVKSEMIKKILDMVYQENQARRAAYLEEEQTGITAAVVGAESKTRGQKDFEIYTAEHHILSLDHIRGMTADEAMWELVKYPGIGVKTASCVLLFCLQYPSFAVDTHVWRMCRWLKWVPANANRDKTFSHCDFKVPNHLKYGLHQLFIHHGKNCVRCRAGTVEGTQEWKNTSCPMEHLLNRSKRATKARMWRKKKSTEDDTDETEEVKDDGDNEADDAAETGIAIDVEQD
jgi:endonuclease III